MTEDALPFAGVIARPLRVSRLLRKRRTTAPPPPPPAPVTLPGLDARPPPPARLAAEFGWIRVAKSGVARAAQINQPWGQAAPGSQPPSRDEEGCSGRQARSGGATPRV